MTTVLYFVKDGEKNEELRYSLRSLTNFDHDRVVIVGGKPSWVTGVDFIRGNRHPGKWANVYDNLRIACEQVGGEFVVMNDDIYFTRPTERLPSWHRGDLAEHIAKIPSKTGPWRRSLTATEKLLHHLGFPDPLSYEAHIPVRMDAARLAHVLELGANLPDLPQWRTLYGNYWQIPADRIADDVKIRKVTTPWDSAHGFLSSDDRTWEGHPAAKQVRAMFPNPCRYEGQPNGAAQPVTFRHVRDRRQITVEAHAVSTYDAHPNWQRT